MTGTWLHRVPRGTNQGAVCRASISRFSKNLNRQLLGCYKADSTLLAFTCTDLLHAAGPRPPSVRDSDHQSHSLALLRPSMVPTSKAKLKAAHGLLQEGNFNGALEACEELLTAGPTYEALL